MNLSIVYIPQKGPTKPGAKLGPYHSDTGKICPACLQPLRAGDHTTLVPLGPGPDAEAQARAASGKRYNAVALEVHWSCAGGETRKGGGHA